MDLEGRRGKKNFCLTKKSRNESYSAIMNELACAKL